MVTKIVKVQQDSSIFKIGHYKCPFFIFGEWSWEKLSRFLYILSIFILKETTFGKSWAKSVATESVAVWLHLLKGGLGEILRFIDCQFFQNATKDFILAFLRVCFGTASHCFNYNNTVSI